MICSYELLFFTVSEFSINVNQLRAKTRLQNGPLMCVKKDGYPLKDDVLSLALVKLVCVAHVIVKNFSLT